MSHQLPAEFASDLDPIIVTSPTIRSGTTLLQRLLCSSSNALIYGEECGKDLELMLQLYASKVTTYSLSRQRFSASLRRVLEGDVNDWILDLMPDVDGYVRALRRSYFSGPAYCRDYAAEVGRPVWGIKYPGWPPHFISLLRRVIPNARLVIIYRDAADSLRSAKARRSVNSEQEARQFCNEWRNNLAFMLGLKDDPSALLVNYAELLGEPEQTIEAISRYTGARDIRTETLSHKINARFDADGNASNQPGYIEPATLTETEERLAAEAASAVGMGGS